MRCTLLGVAASLLAFAPLTASAQVRSFPYEAVVRTSGVPVHSGPGFYATSELKAEDRVVVHRHDPGGWFMISPPSGEFSLIRAADATVAGDQAQITAEETVARVGSRLTADHGVEQIPLAKGDRVELAAGVTAPVGWLAIKPPRGEYRWISGRFLVPVDDSARAAQDTDPFAVPSAASPNTFEPVEKVLPKSRPAPQSTGPTLTLGKPETSATEPKTSDIHQSLRLLDRELEGLNLSEPTDWPLDRLMAEYLRIRTENPSMGRQIDVRLAQIAKMRIVKSHYSDYVQLTSATDERDALLAAKQGKVMAGRVVQALEAQDAQPQLTLAPPLKLATAPLERQLARPAAAPPAESKPSPMSGPHLTGSIVNQQPAGQRLSGNRQQPEMARLPRSYSAVQQPSRPPAAPASVPALQPAGPQRFEAVGLVQKSPNSPPDAPKHVLVAPDGRILEYLRTPAGVSLDQFIGQPMGVDGERHRHPAMPIPMIAVEKLTPVRF